MAGANIQWPQDLGLNITRLRDNPTTSSVMKFSWVLAAPFFSGALVAFFITDPLVNEGLPIRNKTFRMGRRWAIIMAAIFSLVSVVAAAFTQNWKSLMACRILLGVGMGTKASIVPIYLSENG
jgi:MFS family permease